MKRQPANSYPVSTIKSSGVTIESSAARSENWCRDEMNLRGLKIARAILLLADLRSGLGDTASYEISLNLELLLRV